MWTVITMNGSKLSFDDYAGALAYVHSLGLTPMPDARDKQTLWAIDYID